MTRIPIRTSWDRFLFQHIDIKQYAVLRIALGILITLYLLELLPFHSLHFSPDGWLEKQRDLSLYNSGSWSLLFFLENKSQTWFFFLGTIACSVAFSLGFLTKLSGLATFIALVSIWNRNPILLDGDDAILRVMLFFLLFSPCGRVYSIDSLFHSPLVKSEIWPLRMIQFQMAFIYFVSGWVKFHSQEWQDGTILQYVLVHPEYARWDFAKILSYPLIRAVLNAVTFTIMWWELLFPILMIGSRTRTPCLLLGIAFHLGLLMFMNLRWFSCIMLVLYLAFLPNRFFYVTISHQRSNY